MEPQNKEVEQLGVMRLLRVTFSRSQPLITITIIVMIIMFFSFFTFIALAPVNQFILSITRDANKNKCDSVGGQWDEGSNSYMCHWPPAKIK